MLDSQNLAYYVSYFFSFCLLVCLDTAEDQSSKIMHARHGTLPLSNILAKSNMESTCFNK